jgi:hypothetical protein
VLAEQPEMSGRVQFDVHPAYVPGDGPVDAQPEASANDLDIVRGRFVQNQAESGAESTGGGDDPHVPRFLVGKKVLEFLQGGVGAPVTFFVFFRDRRFFRKGLRHCHGPSPLLGKISAGDPASTPYYPAAGAAH